MSAQETIRSLPFWVNGTLEPQERAALEAIIAEDTLVAAEAEALAAIRADMQAETVRSPGEFGLARLMRDVERDLGRDVRARPAPVRRPWVWQIAAAVAMALFIGQALFKPQASFEAEQFQLASAALPGALEVAFAPQASEESIRSVLLAVGVEIVAGPSALGFYRLDLQGGVTDESAINDAAQALRMAAGVVEVVQNVE